MGQFVSCVANQQTFFFSSLYPSSSSSSFFSSVPLPLPCLPSFLFLHHTQMPFWPTHLPPLSLHSTCALSFPVYPPLCLSPFLLLQHTQIPFWPNTLTTPVPPVYLCSFFSNVPLCLSPFLFLPHAQMPFWPTHLPPLPLHSTCACFFPLYPLSVYPLSSFFSETVCPFHHSTHHHSTLSFSFLSFSFLFKSTLLFACFPIRSVFCCRITLHPFFSLFSFPFLLCFFLTSPFTQVHTKCLFPI